MADRFEGWESEEVDLLASPVGLKNIWEYRGYEVEVVDEGWSSRVYRRPRVVTGTGIGQEIDDVLQRMVVLGEDEKTRLLLSAKDDAQGEFFRGTNMGHLLIAILLERGLMKSFDDSELHTSYDVPFEHDPNYQKGHFVAGRHTVLGKTYDVAVGFATGDTPHYEKGRRREEDTETFSRRFNLFEQSITEEYANLFLGVVLAFQGVKADQCPKYGLDWHTRGGPVHLPTDLTAKSKELVEEITEVTLSGRKPYR